MISNDDSNTDGKSSLRTLGDKGSAHTVSIGSRSLPLYLLVIVCLGLLNTVLVLTAVVIGIYCGNVNEVSEPHLITAQALIIEVKHLQIMQTEVNKAQGAAQRALKKELKTHQQLKLHLEHNKTLSDHLQWQFEQLRLEKETLQSSLSDIQDNCGQCLPGWFLFNTSCYFHSKSASVSNSAKNWSDSRADCISRGSDLTVIDSWEEQLNLFEYLPKLHPGVQPWWSTPGGIWIGLSDSETEGSWVWVNNVTLENGGYWKQGEPNNHGAQGEDCAALMINKKPRETWFDANCLENKEWLCEMKPN